MKVNDVLNLSFEQFMKMNTKELRQATKIMVDVANKRLKRFELSNEYSPAVSMAMQSGGKFSIGGKDLNQLRAEYRRVEEFLRNRTSSIKEWKVIQNKTISTLSKQGINVSRSQFNELWRTYEKTKNIIGGIVDKQIKYDVVNEINEMLIDRNKSSDEIVSAIRERYSLIYEEAKRNYGTGDNIGVSEFFE